MKAEMVKKAAAAAEGLNLLKNVLSSTRRNKQGLKKVAFDADFEVAFGGYVDTLMQYFSEV